MYELTATERKIMNMFAYGFSNQEIAEKMSMTKSATKCYISNIYNKLQNKIQTKAYEN